MKSLFVVIGLFFSTSSVFAASYFNCGPTPDTRTDRSAKVAFNEDGINGNHWSIFVKGKNVTKSARVTVVNDGYEVDVRVNPVQVLRYVFTGYRACDNGENGQVQVIFFPGDAESRRVATWECSCAVD